MREFVFVMALFVSACATTELEAPPSTAPTTTASLPAQTLSPGECGLFGYSTDTPPNFIFFASSTGETLYQAAAGRVETLTAESDFPASDYGRVSLELGAAEGLIDGRRYNGARLVERLEDGFERVRPVVVLESCG